VAVNSIIWARIMAQIVYYFYAGLTPGAPQRRVSFAVPTGNFGDIYAGFLAKRMGLPVDRLIIATNANDILHRFISRNRYERTELLHTLSPSMDIVVSSNFERALFDAYGGDAAAIADLMGRFRREAVTVPDAVFGELRRHFDSAAVDDSRTCATIAEVFERCGYLLDPHSAIAVRAALDAPAAQAAPVVALATAHPAKFPEAVIRSGQSHEPALPAHLADLFQREERYRVVARDRVAVQGAVCDALATG
jgi:threonine synthase